MTRLIAGGFVVIVLVETVAFVVDPRAALPVAGLAVAGFVLLAADRLAGAQAAPRAPAGTAADESLRRWRAQTEAVIAWADSTRGDWDRHLRPRLAREFMMATGHRDDLGDREAAAQQETGLMVFGEELWPWVDSRNVTRTGRDAPGPGRAALEEILRRLEQI